MTRHGLRFSPASHRYWLDGKPVPGVTSIIGVLDKPAIPKWAATQVATHVAENPAAVEALRPLGVKAMVAALKEVPWESMRKAGDRGTTFHDLADRIVRGEEVEVPDEQVPLVQSALHFIEEWRIDPILTETAVGDRANWFAGTFDLVARYRRPDTGESGVGIFDWKSGRAIYTEACYQLNAYAGAEFYGLGGDEKPLAALGIGAAFGVHVRADGFDVYPVRFGPDVFDEFLAIRRVADIHKRARGNWKIPGSGYVGRAIQFGETDD